MSQEEDDRICWLCDKPGGNEKNVFGTWEHTGCVDDWDNQVAKFWERLAKKFDKE